MRRAEIRKSTGSWDCIGVRVVEAVARRQGADPDEVPLLADTIDPESLAGFVRSSSAPVEVRFEYAGYEVRISNSTGISLTEVDG